MRNKVYCTKRSVEKTCNKHNFENLSNKETRLNENRTNSNNLTDI